jgi:hypothetical protein
MATGRRCEFRHLAVGGDWFNDSAPHNSVIDTTRT